MKIKVFGAIISVLFTALMVYIIYICRGEVFLPVLFTGGLTVLVTSFMGTGVKVEPSRIAVLNSITSWLFCGIFCAANILFAWLNAGLPVLIIVNGILLIAYMVIIRALLRAGQ